MHRRECEKYQRHRRVNGLPQAEPLLLRGHPPQPYVDLIGRQPLFMELLSPVIERPQRQVMDSLPDYAADGHDSHRRQRKLRDQSMHVRAGMKHDQEGADHACRYMDLKPAARPPVVSAQPLFDRVHEDQQNDSQARPAHEVPLPGMGEG